MLPQGTLRVELGCRNGHYMMDHCEKPLMINGREMHATQTSPSRCIFPSLSLSLSLSFSPLLSLPTSLSHLSPFLSTCCSFSPLCSLYVCTHADLCYLALFELFSLSCHVLGGMVAVARVVVDCTPSVWVGCGWCYWVGWFSSFLVLVFVDAAINTQVSFNPAR
jgi:hypothetical protein